MSQPAIKLPTLTAVGGVFLGVAITLGSQWLIDGIKAEPPELAGERGRGKRVKRPESAGQSAARPGKSARAAPGREGRGASLFKEEPVARLLDYLEQRERKAETSEIETRLALWADRLNLSESQEETLRRMMRRHLDDRLAATEEEGPEDREIVQETELRTMLDGILSKEQKEAYAALQDTQRWNEIDSRAMRRLADLQLRLDLSEAQRDQLLEVFHSHEIGVREGEDGNKPGGYQAFIEGGGSQEDWRAHREKMARVWVEKELDLVRGVLSERQLNTYQEHLERRREGYPFTQSRNSRGSPLIPR